MAVATGAAGSRQRYVSPEELAAVGSALADETRARMLRLMLEHEEVACAALETTFSLTKSTISYHVRVLRHAGLIRVRKSGKFYFYALLRDEIAERFPGLLALLGATQLPAASPYSVGDVCE